MKRKYTETNHFKSPSSKVSWWYLIFFIYVSHLAINTQKSNGNISKRHEEEMLQVRGWKEWKGWPTQGAIGEYPWLLWCWRACWNLWYPKFLTFWSGTGTVDVGVGDINHLRNFHVIPFLWRVLRAYWGAARNRRQNCGYYLLFFALSIMLLLLEVCCSSWLSCSCSSSSSCCWCWCCCSLCPSRRGHFSWDKEGEKLLLVGFGFKRTGKGCYKLAYTKAGKTRRLNLYQEAEQQGKQPTNQTGITQAYPIGECFFGIINFWLKKVR